MLLANFPDMSLHAWAGVPDNFCLKFGLTVQCSGYTDHINHVQGLQGARDPMLPRPEGTLYPHSCLHWGVNLDCRQGEPLGAT